jgi:hemerythrin-like metal-binding protein
MTDRDSEETATALKPLVWTTTFEMGDESVDLDHRQFFEIVNRLTAAIRECADSSQIAALCDELVAHSASHFDNEEATMARHRYEELDGHRRDHMRLLKDITKVAAALRHGHDRDAFVSQALKVKELLLRHMLRRDIQYKSHFMASRHS